MRKMGITILTVVALLLISTFAMAQAKAADTLPSFEAYLGGGQVTTAMAGNATTYSTQMETNVFVGFRWFPSTKKYTHFAIDASYLHDTAKIGRWLIVHNFVKIHPVNAYQYSAIALTGEYWLTRSDRGGIYSFIGPQVFLGTSDVPDKLGVTAGFGAQYTFFKKFFVESKLEYWHVEGFIVPIANVMVGKIAIGIRF